VPAADAAFSAALSLQKTIKDAKFIVSAKVELVDADKPAVILVVDEDLKGKFPIRRLLINMTGDDDAKKFDHTPLILKRLAPKLPVVLFITENENGHVAFAYTNGTWFQMIAAKAADPQKTVFKFTHGEPYLRRTFKGTTEEIKKLIIDGLAGKAKLPAVNSKEAPGFGPEVNQGTDKEAQARVFRPTSLALPAQWAGAARKPAQLQADQKWAHIVGDQGVGVVISTPAVSGKQAYLSVADGAIARYGVLYCIDLETRKTVWTFDAGKTMKQGCSSPVLATPALYSLQDFLPAALE